MGLKFLFWEDLGLEQINFVVSDHVSYPALAFPSPQEGQLSGIPELCRAAVRVSNPVHPSNVRLATPSTLGVGASRQPETPASVVRDKVSFPSKISSLNL